MSEREHLREWLSDDVIATLELDAAQLDGRVLAGAVDRLKPRALWNLRARARERLIERLDAADSDALWLGWAGPLSADTRPGLLLTDLARLDRLLDDPVNAVRLVIAGGPVDADGAAIATRLTELAEDPRFDGRILFRPGWPNADARTLVEGVDVWLGTARAGSTADDRLALAAAANGAINVSTAVSWWAEIPGVDKGWTIGGPEAQDDNDARLLVELLEREVVPLFYGWDHEGVPQRWIERVRASMRVLPPRWDG